MAELLDSYDGFSDTYQLRGEHPSADADISAMGQSIQLDRDRRLTSIKFRLQRTVDGIGTLEVRVYEATGTHGLDAEPTGEHLAVSGEIDIVTGLSTDWTVVEFMFTGENQITLQSDTVYCFEVIVKTLTSGYISMGTDAIAPTHEGNLSGWLNSNWTSTDTYDAQFWLYGEDIGNVYKTYCGSNESGDTIELIIGTAQLIVDSIANRRMLYGHVNIVYMDYCEVGETYHCLMEYRVKTT